MSYAIFGSFEGPRSRSSRSSGVPQHCTERHKALSAHLYGEPCPTRLARRLPLKGHAHDPEGPWLLQHGLGPSCLLGHDPDPQLLPPERPARRPTPGSAGH